ncbi:MAG: signal peptidase II [Elusimicrobia bacterium]|nr:signal peptidase II [Candidatus Liberimonas magnetica]
MKKYINYILLIVLFDQVTKYLVRKNLFLGQAVPVTSFFQVSYYTNTGIAFGMFKGANTVFTVLTIIFFIVFVVYFKKYEHTFSKIQRVSFILILSGALGNLLDRLVHGSVIDFLEFHIKSHYWPAFNVSDSCVTIGGVLLFWSILTGSEIDIKKHEILNSKP